MLRASTTVIRWCCLFVVGLGCSKGTGDGSGTGGAVGSAGTSGGSAGSTGSAGTSGSGTAGTSGSGAAGTTGTSGNAGTTGTTGTAGTRGTAGTTGSGTGTGGTGTATSCTITPTATPSTKIGTVGIVTWTTTLSSPTSAQIDFGLDTNYGMTAPVDLAQASYRTLLLGMKPSKTYHYRITAMNSSGSCVGQDNMIMTGPQMNGLPTFTVTTNNKSALYGGFLVTGEYTSSGGAPAYVLDADGTYVWWYNDGSDACGARMSYDGKYMWIASANVPNNPNTDHTHRVTMDGLTDTDFSTPFAGHSHQITPLPDGSVAFYAENKTAGCDDIKIFPANGTPTSTATTLVNAKTAHGGSGMCHLNNIEYSSSDDTLIFSDLDNVCLTKVSRTTGATVWVLNGNTMGITSTFTGDLWKGGEHGFHIIGVNDILLFNNNYSSPTGPGAIAMELMLDTSAKTSTKLWSYTANPAIQVMVLGDVQRLPNGNTLIDYGTGSQVQEVDKSGNLLQQIKSQVNFGFFEKRATLYGPSTK